MMTVAAVAVVKLTNSHQPGIFVVAISTDLPLLLLWFWCIFFLEMLNGKLMNKIVCVCLSAKTSCRVARIHIFNEADTHSFINTYTTRQFYSEIR